MLQELKKVDELIGEGDLVAAQRMCKRLLQQHPTNAAVHEKMGDVMRRRELWEDAAEWYDLAGQLHETEAIKAKRADVLQRARETRSTGPEPHLVEDADSPRRLMLWLGIAAAAMLLVAVGVIWSIARGGDGDDATPATRVADSDGPVSRSPGLTAPSPVRGTRSAPAPSRGTQSIPTARANPEHHWSAGQMPRRAPRRTVSSRSRTGISVSSASPVTDHDQAVVNAVSSLTWGDNQQMTGRVQAMVDPYSEYAMISVTIPPAIPEQEMVETVVRQAWRVALAAIQADEVINTMTVRMVHVTESGERVVAFRGNTKRAALQALAVDQPDLGTLWTRVFATAWWNPQVGGNLPTVAGGNSGTNGAS
ncbi:MAG: hypothetical protein GF393_12370 [Armatimonadia bacterium]|nr:hypothetical protein [Armatimonadia bacterium]